MSQDKKKTITSDDILGKEAVDPEGQILGIVIKLHISKEEKTLTGITIDQGFMKPDLFIGTDHIKNFGIDTIFLSSVPYDKLKGMKVISSDGEIIGNVEGHAQKSQKLQELRIKFKKDGLFKKPISIKVSEIKQIGDSVIMKPNFKIPEQVKE
ncbi:MAG: PRC-barrel domain-containing protein [Candidatus Woesearchaeota archaeon]